MATSSLPRKTTGRVTPKRAKPKTTYNFDDEMLEEFGPPLSEDEVKTIEVGPLFGEMFDLVVETRNFFTMAELGDIENDTAALNRFMISMVHPRDQKRFRTTIARQLDLDADRLIMIMKRMVEAVADGNPTNSSSGSRRSANRTAGNELSAAT